MHQETHKAIERLIAKRAAAAKRRDPATAEIIERDLSQLGIAIRDTKDGVLWKLSYVSSPINPP
jgi:cysteinyl-tRNA synthetase